MPQRDQNFVGPPTPPPDPSSQNLFSLPQGLRGPLSPSEQVYSLLSQAGRGVQSGMNEVFGPSIFAGNMPNPYSGDPQEKANFINALAMNAAMDPLRVGVNPSKDVAGKIVDMLHNSQFDPLQSSGFHGPSQGPLATMGTITGKDYFGWSSLEKKTPPIDLYFQPHEQEEAKKYFNAIDAWKKGYSGTIRDSATGEAGRSLSEALARDFGETPQKMYDRLQELTSRSNYQTKGPLYRFSDYMGEFPREKLEYQERPSTGEDVQVPKVGTVFYQGPASYSASPKWPRSSNWMTKSSPLIMVDPGAKTLPIGGMLNFPDQHEHMVGGLMKVIESSPSVVRLRQVGPMVPRKP